MANLLLMPAKSDDFVKKVTAFDALSPAARAHLKSLIGKKVIGVRAVHVGQGDFTAVQSEDGKAVFYFDVGGGCHAGSRSYPWHRTKTPARTLGECFEHSLSPYVFLSHWDHDHWFSAENLTAIAQSHFIAPRQMIAPSHLKTKQRIMPNVRLWPRDEKIVEIQLTTGHGLLIESCSGDEGGDPNHSGLALTLVRYKQRVVRSTGELSVAVHKDAASITHARYRELILLPGDAPYHYVRSLGNQALRDGGRYIGLLAYHHGSQSEWSNATAYAPTANANTHRAGYTYGIKPDNKGCYSSMPGSDAVQGMKDKGWTDRKNTSGAAPLLSALNDQRELDPPRTTPVEEGDIDIEFP